MADCRSRSPVPESGAPRPSSRAPCSPRSRNSRRAAKGRPSPHWPASFASELDDDAAATVAWATRAAVDDNRDLKLRRIALEGLIKILYDEASRRSADASYRTVLRTLSSTSA